MPSLDKPNPWISDSVFGLLQSLNTASSVDEVNGALSQLKVRDEPPRQPPANLGDFSRVWSYLQTSSGSEDAGQQPELPSLTESSSVEALPPVAVPLPPSTPKQIKIVDHPAYASDGATYDIPGKSKRDWWNQKPREDGNDTTADEGLYSTALDTAEDTDLKDDGDHDPATTETLKKAKAKAKQELEKVKKAKKKAKKAAQKAKKALVEKSASQVRGGIDSEGELTTVKKHAPARQASIHTSQKPLADSEPEETRFKPRITTENAPQTPTPREIRYEKRLKARGVASSGDEKFKSESTSLQPVVPVASARPRSPQKSNKSNNEPTRPSSSRGLMHPFDPRWKPGPETPQQKPYYEAFQQPQQTPQQAAYIQSPSHQKPEPNFYSPTPPHAIPIIARSKEDRDLSLRLRLIQDFPQDKKWLTSNVQLANHNSDMKGLHVFVDFSNIWIGFKEQMRIIRHAYRNRQNTYIDPRNNNISFDALVLLLERGRPVRKRVLAGSPPLLPAFDLAKSIGYNTLILEKVYKHREMNEHQRRIEARKANAAHFPNQPSTNGAQSADIGAENPLVAARNAVAAVQAAQHATPTPAIPIRRGGGGLQTGPSAPHGALSSSPETPQLRLVEQGVDEMLHLHMLESIVDYDQPHQGGASSSLDAQQDPNLPLPPLPADAATIVLATGDAAQAEYSSGFLSMVERALRKGWRVELVAFERSISGAYRSRRFLKRWEGRFSVLCLDEYAEFLLGEADR